MCGRYVLLRPDIKELLKRLHLDELYSLTVTENRYNIGPGQNVIAVRGSTEKGRDAVVMNWGMKIPSPEAPGRTRFIVNARGETVRQRPSFRESVKRRRCVFPASGFYEWKRAPGGSEAFLLRRREEKPFFLAGIWESTEEGNDNGIVITTQPNTLMATIHDRMPVMLDVEEAERWIDPGAVDTPTDLIRPFDTSEMVAVAVSDYVNDSRHEGERCWEPPVQKQRADQLDLGL